MMPSGEKPGALAVRTWLRVALELLNAPSLYSLPKWLRVMSFNTPCLRINAMPAVPSVPALL